MPHVDQTEKEELTRLVNELRQQLEQVPSEMTNESEKLTRRLEVLIEEISQHEPDKEAVKITGKSLEQAAKNIAKVIPTILAHRRKSTASAPIAAH